MPPNLVELPPDLVACNIFSFLIFGHRASLCILGGCHVAPSYWAT
jgi:hypothetical protein